MIDVALVANEVSGVTNRLAGKVALITGVGAGIGQTAEAFI
jgi:hypothetical protein